MALSNGAVTVSHAPVITTSSFSATRYQSIALSSLFSISNPSQDAITEYQLWDGTSDPNSGFFVVHGVGQAAGTIVTVTAAQLAQTTFVAGKVSDSLQIRALNAAGWSAGDSAPWAPFTVSVPADQAPVVTTHDVTTKAGQQLLLSSLFSFSDPDGDGITKFQIWDDNPDLASGHWVVNGVAQAAGTPITVFGLDSSMYFLTGSVSDRLEIRAFDGVAWSAHGQRSLVAFQCHGGPQPSARGDDLQPVFACRPGDEYFEPGPNHRR